MYIKIIGRPNMVAIGGIIQKLIPAIAKQLSAPILRKQENIKNPIIIQNCEDLVLIFCLLNRLFRGSFCTDIDI